MKRTESAKDSLLVFEEDSNMNTILDWYVEPGMSEARTQIRTQTMLTTEGGTVKTPESKDRACLLRKTNMQNVETFQSPRSGMPGGKMIPTDQVKGSTRRSNTGRIKQNTHANSQVYQG